MPSPFKMLTHTQRFLGATHTLKQSLKNQKLLSDDFSNLRSLRQVVSDHGLNRSLLAYASSGMHLTKLLPTLPAVETLNSVPVSKRDPRHMGSLEAIDGVLSGETASFASWLRDIANSLADVIDSSEDVVDDTREAVSDMMAAMADRVIPDTLLDTTTRTARTADGFISIFTTIAERVRQIGAVDVDAFFSSPDYCKNCASTIETMVEEFKPLMGVKMGDDGCMCDEEDAVDDAYLPREASLTDLGYTEAGIQTVLEKINAVLEAIQEFTERQDTITSRLMEMADRLDTPDVEKPFDISEAQTLISNYADVIVLLVRDGFHHIHEALDVISDIVDNADPRSEDGRSD